MRRRGALGLGIAIDDFGTGQSSLAYLKALPVDDLKIDRTFIGPLLDGERNEKIVRAIIDLAHDLDLRAIAEGIECPRSLERLRSLACDMGQGYVFARPMPADELAGWLGTIPGAPDPPRSARAATV